MKSISGSMQLDAVSLFSGGGGLDLGLEAAGFTTLFASDIDYHSCQTLKSGKISAARAGKLFFQEAAIMQADVAELSAEYILETIGRKPGEIAVLAGGPPCQAFSVFGKRQGREDPRGMLAYEYLRILKGLQPAAFVLENVYGMLSIEGGRVMKDMIEQLSNPAPGLYYEVSKLRLDASNYGVPQFRDRVFIFGHIGGNKVTDMPRLTSNHQANLSADLLGLPPWRTVRDAFRGLPAIGDPSLPNHTGRVHSSRIIERYADMKPGARDKFTRINKLNLDRPSFTIVVGSDNGGGKGHIHPLEPREVTPRESARIQTFPDWWAFSGTSRHPIRQVGNAVPPVLAASVGNAIKEQLLGFGAISFSEVLSILEQEHLFSLDERASFKIRVEEEGEQFRKCLSIAL